MEKLKPKTIPDYISQAPETAQEKLWEIYDILKKVAPDAKEAIKWNTPVLELDRILFAFGAYKTHINFMPTPAAMAPFKKELAKFKTGKGTIQLPYDKPLPKVLLRKIAAYRLKDVKENDARWM